MWSLRRLVGTLCIVVGLLSAGCGDSDSPSSDTSWIERTKVTAPQVEFGPSLDAELGLDPAEGNGVPCGLVGEASPGTDAPGLPDNTGSGTETTRGTDNDPYTATGARQVPGPNMARSEIPTQPISRNVAAPVDPDEHVAARQPDGVVTGPIPAPKPVDGAHDPTTPAATANPGASAAPGASPKTGTLPGGAACQGSGF